MAEFKVGQTYVHKFDYGEGLIHEEYEVRIVKRTAVFVWFETDGLNRSFRRKVQKVGNDEYIVLWDLHNRFSRWLWAHNPKGA